MICIALTKKLNNLALFDLSFISPPIKANLLQGNQSMTTDDSMQHSSYYVTEEDDRQTKQLFSTHIQSPYKYACANKLHVNKISPIFCKFALKSKIKNCFHQLIYYLLLFLDKAPFVFVTLCALFLINFQHFFLPSCISYICK